MQVYFAYNPETTDWIWNKEFVSPSAVEKWITEHGTPFKDYKCINFEIELDVNRRWRTAIDHAVNRANNAYMEVVRERQRLLAQQEMQQAIEKARKEGKSIAKSRLTKEQIDLYMKEILIKEAAIKQMRGKIEELQKVSTPETKHLIDIKCEPIQREIDLMEQRLAYIRMEVKEYQDSQNKEGTGSAQVTGAQVAQKSSGPSLQEQIKAAANKVSGEGK